MPIIVKHGATGTLGRIAVQAGQARGRQLQAGRDIQITSMALDAQDRATQMGLAARNQPFRFQRAGAAQMEKRQPDPLMQRRKLRRFVSEAKAAGIYDPVQIKQMQLFADLGDEGAVRSLAARITPETARRQELLSQQKALGEMTRSSVGEIQQQLDAVNKKLGTQFTKGTQQLLRERPEFMASVSSDVQELLAQQQDFEEQIVGVMERATLAQRKIGLGIGFPEQAAIERTRLQRIEQKKALDLKQLIAQNTRTGKLTDTQDLQIDLLRGPERTVRNLISKEISRLREELVPLKGETEISKKYLKRVEPIQTEVKLLMDELIASHGRESAKIESFVLQVTGREKGAKAKTGPPPFWTTPDGRKLKFSGEYEDGKPQYDVIEEPESEPDRYPTSPI